MILFFPIHLLLSTGGFNRTVVHRKQVLIDAIDKREPKRPLITACNHYSMADDPVLACK